MTGRDPERSLLDIAASLADDTDVDWAAVDDVREEDALNGLRRLEYLVHGLRSIAGSPSPRTDATPEELRVQFRWGALEVCERVGRGSYGDVYRAIDTRLETEVALKLVRADRRHTVAPGVLITEARRMAKVRHPNVVTVHGADSVAGRAGYWMDFIHGTTLAETLDVRGALPIREAVRIGVEICAALGAVHDAGMIHGDVKPRNVMLSVSGRALLTDFGAARLFADGADPWPTTTPRIAAPEVWRGAPLSPATDVYALGAVLFRMFGGTWPVDGDTAGEIEAVHARADRTPRIARREDLPDTLVSVIEQMLDPEAHKRPRRVETVRRALLAAIPGPAVEVDHAEPSPSTGGTNLPVPPSSFVGRGREIAELSALIGAQRLVTMTGPGGTGKTRLAVQLGSRHVGDFPGGVWWVDLADTADGPAVLRVISRRLGIGEGAQHLLSRVSAHLRTRRTLLILDNCEHVLDALRDVVTALVAASSTTSILATSREPLHVDGEVVYRVPPLSLPDPSTDPTAACSNAEAARLFVDRASSADRTFALTPETAQAVREICYKTDGLPLALELAASRLAGLAVTDVAAALTRHLGLLGGSADGGRRHDTIDACIDWSHQNLDEHEKLLFARLSVFRGGWRLEDAERLTADADLARRDVPVVVAALVEKSFVELDLRLEGVARYRMLETLRAHAAKRLDESGSTTELRRRHAERFLSLATTHGPALASAGVPAEISRLEEDHDNLVAALEMLVEAGDVRRAASLAASLATYWLRTERWREGRSWCRRLLELTVGHDVSADRAELLRAAGAIEFILGNAWRALVHVEAAVEAFAALGDQRGVASSLKTMGSALQERGDIERAQDVLEQSLAKFDGLGDRLNAALVMKTLAAVLCLEHAFERAEAMAQRAESVFRQLGDEYQLASTLAVRGDIAMDSGHPDEAIRLRTESLDIARRVGGMNLEAMALTGLASVALARGELTLARTHAETARGLFARLSSVDEAVALRLLALIALEAGELELARQNLLLALRARLDQGAARRVAIIVWTYGRLALALDRPEIAARLQAAAHAHAIRLGMRRGMAGLRDAAPDEDAVRRALGEERDAIERSAGARLSIDDAIGLALAACG